MAEVLIPFSLNGQAHESIALIRRMVGLGHTGALLRATMGSSLSSFSLTGFLLTGSGWLGRLAGRTLTRLIRRPRAIWVFCFLVLIFNTGLLHVNGPVSLVPVLTGTLC